MTMRNIDVMLSKPGIYVLMTRAGISFVEVDDGGRCWQLEPHSGAYDRDGELRPGRWNVGALVDIHGPFARPAKTAVEV